MRQHGSNMAQHSPNMASNLGPKKCHNYVEIAPYVALGAKLAQHGSKDPPDGLEDPQVGAKMGPKTPNLEPKWPPIPPKLEPKWLVSLLLCWLVAMLPCCLVALLLAASVGVDLFATAFLFV